MAYYNVCPVCGGNLDPGERCDCQSIRAKEQEKNRLFFSQMLRTEKNSGQIVSLLMSNMKCTEHIGNIRVAMN